MDKLDIVESRLLIIFDLFETKCCSGEDEAVIDAKAIEGVLQNLMDSIDEIQSAKGLLEQKEPSKVTRIRKKRFWG